jgi:putative ABC transport system permease protein
MGLLPEGELFRLTDLRGDRVELPPEGMVLSEKLAEILDVRTGEEVVIEVLEGRRPIASVPVLGLVRDFAGLSAYMRMEALNRLMREGGLMSGAFIAAPPERRQSLYSRLKRTPQVAAVAVKEAALNSFRQTMAETILRMRLFNVAFAVVIAFGVVYNTARISLSERSRDLATLRVIGFSRREISLIQLGELAALTAAAIPLGLLLGYLLAALSTTAYDTELFRIPFVIDRSTHAFAAAVILIAAGFSGLVVRRMLDRLDLVAVLKSKE